MQFLLNPNCSFHVDCLGDSSQTPLCKATAVRKMIENCSVHSDAAHLNILQLLKQLCKKNLTLGCAFH